MSRYISKLPPEIRELAEKRRSECKHGFGFSSILVDAFSWADTKEGYLFWESMLNENYSVFYTLYPNKNCTCNSRTVDEQGNVVHFEECEKEKDKLDELIDFIEDELDKADAGNITLKKIVYAKILNKAKEIKNGNKNN
jgi:hypothetical protein